MHLNRLIFVGYTSFNTSVSYRRVNRFEFSQFNFCFE